jgi:hypothetical protein
VTHATVDFKCTSPVNIAIVPDVGTGGISGLTASFIVHHASNRALKGLS